MLSPEEVLLFQAVKAEQERQEATQAGGIAGGIGGAALGALGGTVPHKLGNALNKRLTGRGNRPVSIARAS